jgi:hypothetical protein
VKVHTILGIRFFGGTAREAVDEISRNGGLLVAPAAPSMINLCRDEDYRRALLSSDLAIADSGFSCSETLCRRRVAHFRWRP